MNDDKQTDQTNFEDFFQNLSDDELSDTLGGSILNDIEHISAKVFDFL